KRASEYELIYQKPERQTNLKQLQETLGKAFYGLDLLEVACGTGFWTQFACRSATSIVATDYNEEVLTIAREKEYGDCPVTFVKADAYVLDEVNGPFSAALVGFWWSHVPKAKLDNFLKILHSKLSKGATVIMLDNQYVEGSSTPISRTDNEGNTYQMRKLSDGSIHEVLKNFPTQTEYNEQIEPLVEDYNFVEMEYFWIARYTLKSIAEQTNASDA
ncbi:MAG: class I SAM-dependent methyltransferase, partial [Candidatus Aegiribacteria sp.]|nr:class I SAM-dependent methyltransferase [Candidatus Aegiribacteria sp.]